MTKNPRGLLDILPVALLGYLFEFLPQNNPLSEWVPGQLLTDEFVQRLRESEFTGFAHVKQNNNLRGIFIFFKGRLLEVWSFVPFGCATGVDAYQVLTAEMHKGGLALYKLPTESIPAVLAFTSGTTGVVSADAKIVNATHLKHKLEQERFSGILVLENGSSGQTWLFQRGVLLFPPPIPDEFRGGTLHMVYAPAKAPPDLFEAMAEQQRLQRKNELERIWLAAADVLNDQLGRGALQALENQKKRIVSNQPEEVFAQLRRFFEGNFEPDAITDFEQRLSSKK